MTREPRPAPIPRTARQDAMVVFLAAAGRVQQALDEALDRHGITHDQYNVLRILRGAHLVGHPRYAIAERLLSRAPDVTRLLNRLVRAGLVERYRSEEDQRLSMSRVTERGLDLLGRADADVRDVHERVTGALDERRLEQLVALSRRLAPASEDR